MEEVLSRRSVNVKKYVSSLQFDQFSPLQDIPRKGFASIIVAKRGLGKSTFLKDILQHLNTKKWYSTVHVFSLTAEFQPGLFDYVPKANVHKGFDQDKMRSLWAEKDLLVKRELAKGRNRDDLPFDLIICDDLIGDKKACRRSQILTDFYVAGRHLNFAVVFLTQYFCAIPPIIRNNTDFVVCFALRTEKDQKHFVEEYLSAESNAIGYEILRKNTVDVGYQCMVVLCNKNVSDPQEYVRVYTASVDVPDFLIEGKSTGAKGGGPKGVAMVLNTPHVISRHRRR